MPGPGRGRPVRTVTARRPVPLPSRRTPALAIALSSVLAAHKLFPGEGPTAVVRRYWTR
jgi:hypothetical protein